MEKKITYKLETHQGNKVILIIFEYDKELHKKIKSLKGAKWSNTHKAWYVPDNATFREIFKLAQKEGSGKTVLTKIHPKNHKALEELRNTLILKGYSPSTRRTYIIEFAQLLYLLKGHQVDLLTSDRLRGYFLYCHQELKLSDTAIHNRINAIKFYFEQVLKRERIFVDIPRPKRPSTLPKAISIPDVKKILEASSHNLKHNTMLKLCYGMGLRVSEIVNLKIKDIDSKRMQVHIVHAKGKKDRYVNLPNSILEQLRNYVKEHKPKQYLFEGQYDAPYSIRSAQSVFKAALKKAKINKDVGIHGLRHSYATHLLEKGTDISYIQKLLGHSNIKTTLIYTQVSTRDLGNITSPLDDL